MTLRRLWPTTQRASNIHAILNPENIGLAAGNNAALGKCQGDYILILNPDTLCRQRTLECMVDFLDHNPQVGVAGPKNVYSDGPPTPAFTANGGCCMSCWGGSCPIGWHARSTTAFRPTNIRTIGGYDPEYFLTVEDACDLCIRSD